MQDLLLLGSTEGIKMNDVTRAKKIESGGEGKAAQGLIGRVWRDKLGVLSVPRDSRTAPEPGGAEGKAEATRKRAEPGEVCGVPLSLTQTCLVDVSELTLIRH